MELVFYFFSFDRSAGGAERALLDLAGAMRLRGHGVRVVSWDDDDARSFYPFPSGVRWYRLGARAPLRKLRRTGRLLRTLARERPDVFVGFVMGADKSIYFVNRLLGIPIVAAERSSPAMYRARLSPRRAAAYAHLFALCRGIAVQFESYRDGYPARVHDRITVIPNAVRVPERPAQPGTSSPPLTLLFLGRFSEEKQLAVLVDAFRRLAPAFPEWRLRMVGDGVTHAEVAARVRAAGLGDRITLPGAVEDVAAEYAAAHAFVLPSRWEGFPNALAEALAHGLPAVGFADCPGANELIVPGKTGVLARGAGDAEALAEALVSVMRDAAPRASMGERAREAMAAYAPDLIYDRWESFLLRCAGRS